MNKNQKAATRARILADVLRDRMKGHLEPAALRLCVRNLIQAARVLEETSESGHMPEAADRAMWRARTAAHADDIPCDVFDYVSAPITGWSVELPELRPADPAHVRQENELRARAIELRGYLDSREERVLAAAIAALVDVHEEHKRLAAHVALHGRADARPTNYRPHSGSRTAIHVPGHLTVFDGCSLLAELAVPYGITSGEIWQLIVDVQPACA